MPFYLAYLLAFYLAWLLALSHGILSGISSGILSGISSGILSDMLSGVLSGISSGILSGRWGPAALTELGKSQVEVQRCSLSSDGPRLRSSGAHWARTLAVEVQQCPLRAEVGEELGEELARRKWTWKWRQRWWRRRTTLIKSNNPHLAGGKKTWTNTHPIYSFLRQQSFSFFPARVATCKTNLGVGVLVQTGPNDCNDTKSNWVAFTSKKMRLEQNLIACAQWELKTQ